MDILNRYKTVINHRTLSRILFIFTLISYVRRMIMDDHDNSIPNKNRSLNYLLSLSVFAHMINLFNRGYFKSLIFLLTTYPKFSMKYGYDENSLFGHLLNYLMFRRFGDLKLPPSFPTHIVLKFLSRKDVKQPLFQTHLLEQQIDKEFGPISMTLSPVNSYDWTRLFTQFVFVSDPSMVEEVMSNKEAFPTRGNNGFNDMAGEGLLALPTGEKHAHHRRIISKFLSDNYLKSFSTIIEEEIGVFLKIWKEKAKKNARVNAHYDLSMLTLDVIMRIAFGADKSDMMQGSDEELNEFVKIADDSMKVAILRTAMPWTRYIPFLNQQDVVEESMKIHGELSLKIFNKGVKALEKHPELALTSPTMLSALITAKKDDGSPALAEQEILDELETIRGAGHETSANTLCWVMFLLMKNPDKLKKLREEVDRVLGDRRITTYDDTKKLIYTHAIVYETLRLYPTVPKFPREAAFDTKVGGYDITKGSIVFVAQAGMNRNQKYWKDPEQFVPERFADNLPELHMSKPVGIPNGPLFGYLPFGSGNRTCIGQRLAVLEQVMIIPSIVKNFDWSLDMNEDDIVELADITLGPKEGFYLKLTSRN